MTYDSDNGPPLGVSNVNEPMSLENRPFRTRWVLITVFSGLVIFEGSFVQWDSMIFALGAIGYTLSVQRYTARSKGYSYFIPWFDTVLIFTGLILSGTMFIPYILVTVAVMAFGGMADMRDDGNQRYFQLAQAILYTVALYVAYGTLDKTYIVLIILGVTALIMNRSLTIGTQDEMKQHIQLHGLLTLSPSGMIIVSPTKIYVNIRLFHVLGRQPPDDAREYFIYIRGTEPHFVQLLWRAVQDSLSALTDISTQTAQFEKSVEIEPGDIRAISFLHKRERFDSHKVVDVLTVHDMTETRQLTEQRHGRERLQILGTVTSMAIHEIRNPLAAMRAKAQLMASHSDLQYIQNQAGGLVRMIDDINEFCERLLAVGRVSKRKEQQFEVAQFLHEVLAIMGPLAKRAKVIFKVEDVAANTWVVGDALALRHVLINLIQNGIEALPNGGRLTIRTEVQERHVVFSVEDNGGGIPEHIAARLFEPFYTTKKRGTGLGLVISQQIVEENNGKLYFHSTEHGTVFYCSLPRVVTRERQAQPS